MMMDWRHAENAATEEIAAADLEENADCFDVKNEAEEKERADCADGNGIDGQQCAETERPYVAHEKSRGFDIKIRVCDQCAERYAV